MQRYAGRWSIDRHLSRNDMDQCCTSCSNALFGSLIFSFTCTKFNSTKCLPQNSQSRQRHTHKKSLKAKERERMLLNSWKFFGTRMGVRVRFQWIFPCNTFRFRAVFFSSRCRWLVLSFTSGKKDTPSILLIARNTCLHSMLNRWRVYSFIRLQHNDFEIEFATDKTGNGKALCNTENNVTICLLMDPFRCSSNGKHERNITTLRFDSIAQWNIPAMKFYTSTPLLAFIAAPVNRERERERKEHECLCESERERVKR